MDSVWLKLFRCGQTIKGTKDKLQIHVWRFNVFCRSNELHLYWKLRFADPFAQEYERNNGECQHTTIDQRADL